jgi:hypothetical protein
MKLYVTVPIISFVGGWLGSFLGAYLKKKGENLATHEDIDKPVDQVAVVTRATKQIELRKSSPRRPLATEGDLAICWLNSSRRVKNGGSCQTGLGPLSRKAEFTAN